jgi:hypothetical protein
VHADAATAIAATRARGRLVGRRIIEASLLCGPAVALTRPDEFGAFCHAGIHPDSVPALAGTSQRHASTTAQLDTTARLDRIFAVKRAPSAV